jgi:hypothetical protein
MPANAKSSTLEVVNDATAYGVSIIAAEVVQDEVYWKCIKVHHLTPQENVGNHNVFVDVLDENDQRVYGTRVSLKWPTGSGIGTIDKPPTEPGTNFPLWKNQVVEMEVIGRPSDRVVGLHTGHPDEGAGNTMYHHSFLVVFKRATYDQGGQVNRGTIGGTVKNGAGMTIVLQKAGQQIAQAKIGDDSKYRFEQLAAGTYRVAVAGTSITSADITMDGKTDLVVDMTVPADQPIPQPSQPFATYVLFGAPDAPGTRTNFVLAQDFILRTKVASGFRTDEALLAKRVVIIGDTRGVSQADEDTLTKAGIQVARIAGDSYAVEAALAKLT